MKMGPAGGAGWAGTGLVLEALVPESQSPWYQRMESLGGRPAEPPEEWLQLAAKGRRQEEEGL